MAKLPTIADVARRAGVGKGTASRVLNGSTQVRPATRQRVLDAISELKFRPSGTARNLSRARRMRAVGVLDSFITTPAFIERLRGIQDVVESADDMSMVLFSCRSLDHLEAQIEAIAASHAVEGLIVVDLPLADRHLDLLHAAGIAVAGLNCKSSMASPIGPDDTSGGYLATRHLLDLGHRRIAYVGEVFEDPFGFETSRKRFEGYRRALAEDGIAVDEGLVALGPHGSHTAFALAGRLLAARQRPTAIFAMTDVQAIECLSAASERGLSAPDDLSVVGFDDIEIAAHVGLTTVRQHLRESGRLAAQHLLAVFEADPAPAPGASPLEVVRRRSSGPPPTRRRSSQTGPRLARDFHQTPDDRKGGIA